MTVRFVGVGWQRWHKPVGTLTLLTVKPPAIAIHPGAVCRLIRPTACSANTQIVSPTAYTPFHIARHGHLDKLIKERLGQQLRSCPVAAIEPEPAQAGKIARRHINAR